MLDDIDEEWLADLAGEGAFQRGHTYWRRGHVIRLEKVDKEWDGRVTGSTDYSVLLSQKGEGLRWHCDCPAAADGSFCKHLVAVVLAAKAGDMGEGPVTDLTASADALRAALHQQSSETLTDWLYAIACDHPMIEQELRARLSLFSADDLKANLRTVLRTGGFLDFHRSMDYAEQLNSSLSVLEQVAANDPTLCVELCELAVKRLLKVLETADDSAGAIGEQLHRFAYLHGCAVSASGEGGRALASTLYKLKKLDEWELFPLDSYWEALGEKGQAHYARRVEKEYAALPPPPTSANSRWQAGLRDFGVLRRCEELAFQQNDFDTLVALYSRDLSSGHGYGKLVDACDHFGRDAEAMSWAERAVRAHPQNSDLYSLLAQELRAAGLTEEAVEAIWQAFAKRPGLTYWQQLKIFAADDWPRWRKKGLDLVASLESCLDDGRRDVTERVRLLILDGAMSEAVGLASEHAVFMSMLDELATHCRKDFPAEASAFWRRYVDSKLPKAQSRDYPSLVSIMKKAHQADPGEDTHNWLMALRDQYSRRPALMERMDKAKL